MPLIPLAVPSPTPSPDIDPDAVTPGVIGFIVFAVIAVVSILLIIDMVRRIRRVNARARARARIADELASTPDPGSEAPERAASDPATGPGDR